jgi:putative two-component system response regulator
MPKTLFVVDDSDANLTQAKQALEGHYRVFPLPSALKMLALLEKVIPDLILLDIEMPHLSGIEAIPRLKAKPAWEDIPFIFMTSWEDPLMMSHCLELGAFDIVHKPFADPVLLKRVENCLKTDVLAKHVAKLDRVHKGLVSVLPDLIESRDVQTAGHVERVAAYVELMIDALLEKGVYAEELRTWDLDTVLVAAMLHDVGKIAVPEAILNGNKLTMEEYAVLWGHASAGEQIIDALIGKTGANELWSHARRFAGSHHENWNGSGYPNALKAEQIPLEGRILAVASMYDALRYGRYQTAAVDHTRAVGLIQRDADVRYDPKVVAAFLESQKAVARVADAQLARNEPVADALNIAKKLIGMGMAIDDIVTVTGLPRKAVERLREAKAQ